MSKDIFKTREQAFENVFFARVDAELIKAMHRRKRDEAACAALSAATGIDDDSLLERLHECGVSDANIEALSLAPLVAVAWADGKLDRDERNAIIQAAKQEGIADGSDAQKLLESWLDVPPPQREFLDTWKAYVTAVLDELDPDARDRFRAALHDHAEKVAKVSGGILGIGSITKEERAVLDEIAASCT